MRRVPFIPEDPACMITRAEPTSVLEIMFVRFAEKVYRAQRSRGRTSDEAYDDVTELIEGRLLDIMTADDRALESNDDG